MIDFELIDPEVLDEWINSDAADRKPVVLEAHFSSIDHPLDGDRPVPRHVPGAIQVHPSYLEAGVNEHEYYPFYDCPEDGNLLPHNKLTAAIELLGVTPETTVVVYGSEPDGTMAASRLIWGLMVAGVEKVRLLDGGIDTWVAHGGATVNEIKLATDIASRPNKLIRARWRVRSEILASTPEVKKISGMNGRAPAKLVDVRKRGEYEGSLDRYYPFFNKAGHIPNAILQGDWDNLIESGSQKLGPNLDRIRSRWQDLGIIDEGVEKGVTSVIFYCGTGWRSSIAFLVAKLLGVQARNYDDGFYGWSWRDQNEVATGGPI